MVLRGSVPLISGELKMSRRLSIVLLQTAKTVCVVSPEKKLCAGIPLVCRELQEPRRVTIVLGQFVSTRGVGSAAILPRFSLTLRGLIVRCKLDCYNGVAGLAAVQTGQAHLWQPKLSAVLDAHWNLHVERSSRCQFDASEPA
jgi:hypothetical protein